VSVDAPAPPGFRYHPPTRLSSLSVVMPAHNEAPNIEAAVREALAAAAAVADRYEVIVVDDGSADDTAAVVESLAARTGEPVRLIRNGRNLGYGPAVRRAWSAASLDWVLFTDSDCQFDLAEVTQLVPRTDEADIVTGWRRDRQDTRLRRLNARVFNIAGRVFFGTRVRDVDCAFKLLRTAALRRLDLSANSAMVNTELLYQARRHGLRVAQVPVSHKPRRYGEATGGDPQVIARAVREFFALRRRFSRPPAERLRVHTRLVAALVLVAGVAATYWAVAHRVVLAYGDAEAHLNIAKRVVGGLTVGLAQLGSVWLPLPHLLMAPFVVDDGLWRAGLAGAAVGVPSLVLLAVSAYRLAQLVTGSLAAAWLAPLVIVANPNTLYLSATPMTEVLLLALVTTSVYFLARWVLHDDVRNLVLAGLCGSLASLSRYDGWALVCVEAGVVAVAAVVRHRRARSVEGLLVLFGFLAFSGIGAWLVWNQLIFGDPLYFAGSVYGSAEQQQFFLHHGLLPTYHDLGRSVRYWLEDVRLIAGATLGALAAAGLAALLARCVRRRQLGPVLVAAAALSSFAFYILSLYLGQASLILPRFAPPDSPWQMSNIRYGVQALLPIGLFVAVLAARRPRVLAPALAAVVLAQAGVSVATGRVMSYADGTRGLSSQAVSKGPDSPAVEAWMRARYDGGLVLMDDYRRPIGPVESGVPMRRFIGVGNRPYWRESLDDPARYATWIVLQQADTDAVWAALSPQSRSIVTDHFVEVFRSGPIRVYKRRPPLDDVVEKRGQHLYLGAQRWNPVGVNSYDLLEQPQDVIDARLARLAAGGHNAVRTWCFDKDGGIRDATLDRLAATLHSAGQRGIRVVCALGNALSDFGGPAYFTPSGEDFYASATARARFREQIRRVLEHRDAAGVRLADNPTVLAWDLLNEPRVTPGTTAAAVLAWTDEMGAYAGSLDQRHLVTVGAEGFRPGYPADPAQAGAPGTGFSALCGVASVTLCSAHLYPGYLPPHAGSREIGRVVQHWRLDADALQKPVLVGEVGYSLGDGGGERGRHEFYDTAARAVNHSDVDGALLWNLGGAPDASLTLAYGDPDSDRVLGAWAAIIERRP
jgi:GT2 family glycosyltransferase